MAIFVEMRFKHGLACRRPHEYSPQVQPIILTPAHGTLPSGHATEAFTAALVLWRLLRDADTKPYNHSSWGKQLMRLAARIAINRTVAGVHFPVDSAAGALLGLTLGQYLVNLCTYPQKETTYESWCFDGTKYPDNSDFRWNHLYDVAARKQTATAFATRRGVETTDSRDIARVVMPPRRSLRHLCCGGCFATPTPNLITTLVGVSN